MTQRKRVAAFVRQPRHTPRGLVCRDIHIPDRFVLLRIIDLRLMYTALPAYR
jgi:hypothetical protein